VGTGAASNLVATAQTPSRYWQDAKVVLLTDHALLQPTAKFAIMPSVVMKWYTPGDPGVQANKWLSFGARPVWYFSKYVSLAAEPGFDYVNNPNTVATGWVRKFTVAPQIGAGREFFSRPVLRLFATYANWSDALRGQVGGTAYQNRRSGFSAGVQMESWW
jgi:maltoporin